MRRVTRVEVIAFFIRNNIPIAELDEDDFDFLPEGEECEPMTEEEWLELYGDKDAD